MADRVEGLEGFATSAPAIAGPTTASSKACVDGLAELHFAASRSAVPSAWDIASSRTCYCYCRHIELLPTIVQRVKLMRFGGGAATRHRRRATADAPPLMRYVYSV